jgi:predicted nucleic acid-binding protein
MRGDTVGQNVAHMLNIAAGHYARLIPLEDIAAAALNLAADLKHPIYDCLYLALAARERCALVTADSTLVAKAKRAKGIEVRKL